MQMSGHAEKAATGQRFIDQHLKWHYPGVQEDQRLNALMSCLALSEASEVLAIH